MNIYLVGPVDEKWVQWTSFVVYAEDAQQARQIALKASGFNPSGMVSAYGQQASFYSAPVNMIGTCADAKPVVILGHFKGGTP